MVENWFNGQGELDTTITGRSLNSERKVTQEAGVDPKTGNKLKETQENDLDIQFENYSDDTVKTVIAFKVSKNGLISPKTLI
jgi:hypothetical protein